MANTSAPKARRSALSKSRCKGIRFTYHADTQSYRANGIRAYYYVERNKDGQWEATKRRFQSYDTVWSQRSTSVRGAKRYCTKHHLNEYRKVLGRARDWTKQSEPEIKAMLKDLEDHELACKIPYA